MDTSKTVPAEVAVVQALRSDLALQIARSVAERGQTQVAAARVLDIPQPTLSKIMRGKVSDLSLELLIRISVRAGLPLVLHTGTDPAEAGVFVPRGAKESAQRRPSRVSEQARADLVAWERGMSAEERLEAQARHSELLAELHRSAQAPRRRR